MGNTSAIIPPRFPDTATGIIALMRSHSKSHLERWLLRFIGGGGLGLILLFGGWGAYEFIPSVHFRAQAAWAQVHEAIAPQPENLPTPMPVATLSTLASASPSFMPPAATVTPTTSAGPSSTATLVIRTATPTITPIPTGVVLTGLKHEYQLFNNCGPASLAINLSYWGWEGSQKNTAAFLKPNQDDKNVSPRELYEYLLTQKFDAYIRVDGTVDTLKRFIAAGYPVLVEKGYTCESGERCSGWFGHYSVFNGYDDAKQLFILQDSFRGPNLTMSYAEVLMNWRAFNYLYFIVFPAGEAQDANVRELLGDAVDLDQNYRAALARAQQEALTLTGQDAAFAWFNVGTNLAALRDYAGAATAYDQARQIGLPYRMLWYQFGPYRAYYQMARYQDVVDLATFAINSVTPGVVPGLEESYFWRGQAEEAFGEPQRAIADYRTALQRHPGYDLAEAALRALGETP